MVIDGKDGRGAKKQLLKDLDLEQVLDRDVENLSGGRQSPPVSSSLSKRISCCYRADWALSCPDQSHLKRAQHTLRSCRSSQACDMGCKYLWALARENFTATN